MALVGYGLFSDDMTKCYIISNCFDYFSKYEGDIVELYDNKGASKEDLIDIGYSLVPRDMYLYASGNCKLTLTSSLDNIDMYYDKKYNKYSNIYILPQFTYYDFSWDLETVPQEIEIECEIQQLSVS